jgi:hypothetical protein
MTWVITPAFTSSHIARIAYILYMRRSLPSMALRHTVHPVHTWRSNIISQRKVFGVICHIKETLIKLMRTSLMFLLCELYIINAVIGLYEHKNC